MSEIERILLECRYLLSLDKTYYEIASYLKLNTNVVYKDLNYKLPIIDHILYDRVAKKLKKINNV